MAGILRDVLFSCIIIVVLRTFFIHIPQKPPHSFVQYVEVAILVEKKLAIYERRM